MASKRRRQLFVNRNLQGRLLFQAVVYWLYCLLSISLFAACWIILVKRPTSSAQLFGELWSSCGPALGGSVLLLPLVLLDCLRISNRFAGPMIRIHHTLQQLADGKESRPIQLRQRDYWQELAQSVNLVMERGVKPQPMQSNVDSETDSARLSSNSSLEDSAALESSL